MASVNDIKEIIDEFTYLNQLIIIQNELVSKILISEDSMKGPGDHVRKLISGINYSNTAIVESLEMLNWKLQRVLKIETALAASSN